MPLRILPTGAESPMLPTVLGCIVGKTALLPAGLALIWLNALVKVLLPLPEYSPGTGFLADLRLGALKLVLAGFADLPGVALAMVSTPA